MTEVYGLAVVGEHWVVLILRIGVFVTLVVGCVICPQGGAGCIGSKLFWNVIFAISKLQSSYVS